MRFVRGIVWIVSKYVGACISICAPVDCTIECTENTHAENPNDQSVQPRKRTGDALLGDDDVGVEGHDLGAHLLDVLLLHPQQRVPVLVGGVGMCVVWLGG